MTNVLPFLPRVVLPPVSTKCDFADTYNKITLIKKIINRSEAIFDIKYKDPLSMQEALSDAREAISDVKGLTCLDKVSGINIRNEALMQWLFQTTIDEVDKYVTDIPSQLVTAYVVDDYTMRDILSILKRHIDNYVMITITYQSILDRAKNNDIMKEFCNAVGDELFASKGIASMYLIYTTRLTEIIENHRFDILMKTAKDKYCLPESINKKELT